MVGPTAHTLSLSLYIYTAVQNLLRAPWPAHVTSPYPSATTRRDLNRHCRGSRQQLLAPLPTRMEERQPLTGRAAAGDLPPALRRALRVREYPRWKLKWLQVPWYQLGNGLFVAAMISYVAAAREWLAIEGGDQSPVPAPAWDLYNRLTLIGAVLFVVEPLADFTGRWAATVFATLEQARWECSTGSAMTSPVSRLSNGDDGDRSIRSKIRDLALDDSAAVAADPSLPLLRLSTWVWKPPTAAWTEASAPSTAQMMRADLGFWAAV